MILTIILDSAMSFKTVGDTLQNLAGVPVIHGSQYITMIFYINIRVYRVVLFAASALGE